MIVHEIPGVLVVEWNEEAKTMVDTWSNYTITAAQFRDAVLEKGVAWARVHGGRAWVVDSSKAKGAMPAEVQKLIETQVFKTFASIGVKYFVTIKSGSAITNMAISTYSAHVGPAGIQLVEIPDKDKAMAWLKEHR